MGRVLMPLVYSSGLVCAQMGGPVLCATLTWTSAPRTRVQMARLVWTGCSSTSASAVPGTLDTTVEQTLTSAYLDHARMAHSARNSPNSLTNTPALVPLVLLGRSVKPISMSVLHRRVSMVLRAPKALIPTHARALLASPIYLLELASPSLTSAHPYPALTAVHALTMRSPTAVCALLDTVATTARLIQTNVVRRHV